ncbi:NAD(P)-dependent oxidoreductase [Rhodobacteraceae bacterium NNCM2]|nr:NAD(P)-dependent oxidoreductase [Coraliihabitans acroporae]
MIVAILMPGDMGHGVGQSLIANGHDVITSLEGRSAHTRGLAERAGLRDVGTIAAAVAEAELILSILPPDRAVTQAHAVADAMRETGAQPAYADCNAISPDTAKAIAAAFDGLDATIIDCGIIGLNPIKSPPTRFYVSGPDCSVIKGIASDALRIDVIGDAVGQASALKMVYAALTKGTWTLQTALLMTAMQLGVLDPLLKEFEYSQSGKLSAMRQQIPFLPADSARWVAEMEEIAATFASAGVTPGFHKGAADVFRVMAKTPYAAETRETLDRNRTLEEALAEYVKHL